MAVAFVTAFCFALGAACWMLMELFRHHGRLLVRLEAIESKLDLAKQDHSQASVGEPAHPFVLPTPTGTKVGLTDLIALGRRVLLIFVDPNCPACETLQPYLARWERELSGRLTVALIVRGTAQANHHKVDNIRWVLLEGESEVWRAYACERTPSAVVVGTDARIGSPVMKGPQPIIAFLENAMPAVPNQTQPGDISLRQLVPALRLIDTGGRSAGLDEIAGKPTLLVFWNPACPYCRTLAELLRGNQEVPEIDTPRLIIISLARETADLRCPVFVDPDGYLMRSLGARSTPAAVLLDAETKLLSVVAIGAENVIQLIGSVSSAMSSS
jgi:thiol-disulfide isomerase/thioredoxin